MTGACTSLLENIVAIQFQRKNSSFAASYRTFILLTSKNGHVSKLPTFKRFIFKSSVILVTD